MKFYERVISDFGGYEKCKEILKQPNIGFIMNAQALREHMLKYRRQHNIFEVGDLVTYKAHFKGMWREGFGKITEIDEDLEVVNIDENVGVAISEIEHANDEGIKAGKRLEVNQ